MLQCFEVIPYFIYRDRFRASLSLLGTTPSVAPWGFFVGHFSKAPAFFFTVVGYNAFGNLPFQAKRMGGVPRIPRFKTTLPGGWLFNAGKPRSVFQGFKRT